MMRRTAALLSSPAAARGKGEEGTSKTLEGLKARLL